MQYIHFFVTSVMDKKTIALLAFIAKYGVSTNQWTWLCQALLEVSMTTIVLWICVCADDWAAELAVKASNVLDIWKRTFKEPLLLSYF